LFAKSDLQAKQLLPLDPHWDTEGCTQLPLSQHPAGHETPSQKQPPLMQRWPAVQGGLTPQLHVPSALQVSVANVAQELQDAPSWPQTHGPPSVGQLPGSTSRHDDPRQHPAQVAGVQLLQRPSLQVWPLGQLWQLKPPLPHSVSRLPARQVCPSGEQQPGQLAGSQTQEPFEHFCPKSQGGFVPHAQMPELEQLSDRIGSQAVQARPPFPHNASSAVAPASGLLARDSQTLFPQHPVAQETPSQAQAPFWQC